MTDTTTQQTTKSVVTLTNGNAINRRGRPKGSTSIHSKEAIKRLESLGFDPIQQLVEQYEEVTQKIEKIENSPRPSSMALAQLYTLKKSISDTLIKYAYKPVATTIDNNVQVKPALKITLGGLDDDE
jgi:archaellum biogenesis ATPase FlaH